MGPGNNRVWCGILPVSGRLRDQLSDRETPNDFCGMLVFQQGGSGFAFRVRVHIGNLASFPLRREARPKTEGMSVSCDSCLVRFPYKPAARPMPRQESAIISFICGRYRLSRRKQLGFDGELMASFFQCCRDAFPITGVMAMFHQLRIVLQKLFGVSRPPS